MIMAVGCVNNTPTAILSLPTTTSKVTSTEASSEWYAVYFTAPLGPAAEYYSGGPDEALAQAIDSARLSVDVAVYDLDLSTIANALIDAQRRGVVVRVVTESDNLDSPSTKIPALKEAGIPVIGDRREGLMHHKYTVIDRTEVWTGSMNYTSNDAYRNDHNLIRIRSTRLAEDYTAEFTEMFVLDLFGPGKHSVTPNPVIGINGSQVEVYFSPDDGVASRIIDLLSSAQESIYFLAYSFNADGIADVILRQAQAGVKIAGVFEKTQVSANAASTEYHRLKEASLDVWLDGNPKNMHDKIILIDEQIVITGSYNFTAAAEDKNDENILVIHNPEIASQYLQDFWRIYRRAKK